MKKKSDGIQDDEEISQQSLGDQRQEVEGSMKLIVYVLVCAACAGCGVLTYIVFKLLGWW